MEEKKPKTKAGGVHAGHRRRMRQRFLTGGLGGFQDHEVLELLLFYAIPRKDVNVLAHQLINRFGTVAAVLDAPEEALQEVPGVGPHVAHFLHLIPELIVQMSRQSAREEPVAVYTPKDLVELMSQRCPECPMGHVLLVLVDRAHFPVAIYSYDGFEELTARSLALHVASSLAALAILVERVDDCTAPPPPQKLQALDQLAKILSNLETPLWDFMTVDFQGHLPHSYARSGQLLPR